MNRVHDDQSACVGELGGDADALAYTRNLWGRLHGHDGMASRVDVNETSSLLNVQSISSVIVNGCKEGMHAPHRSEKDSSLFRGSDQGL